MHFAHVREHHLLNKHIALMPSMTNWGKVTAPIYKYQQAMDAGPWGHVLPDQAMDAGPWGHVLPDQAMDANP